MPQINQLDSTTPTLSDLVAFWSTANGDTRRCSIFELAALIAPDAATSFVTQYAAPNATGFTAIISAPQTFLILSPNAGTYSGTVALPASGDGQEVMLASTQPIVALSIASADPVYGAPATLPAGGYLRLRFDGVLHAWFTIAAPCRRADDAPGMPSFNAAVAFSLPSAASLPATGGTVPPAAHAPVLASRSTLHA